MAGSHNEALGVSSRSMGYGYHAQALSKDVSYRLGCYAGRGNIAAVKGWIEKMRGSVQVDSVEAAANQLEIYFDELFADLRPDEVKLVEQRERYGQAVRGADGQILNEAVAREVRTKIDQATAARFANFIYERTQDWPE